MNEYLMAFVFVSCIILDVFFAIVIYKASKLTGDDEPVKQKEFRQWREHLDERTINCRCALYHTDEKLDLLSEKMGFKFKHKEYKIKKIPAHYEKVSKKK